MIDGQQSDEQYMRQLYIRFRQGIVDNDNSEFYDEDELLDIYDYAQDEGDEMVQLYVFLAGARLYPDSDFLDERKAFCRESTTSRLKPCLNGVDAATALYGVYCGWF